MEANEDELMGKQAQEEVILEQVENNNNADLEPTDEFINNIQVGMVRIQSSFSANQPILEWSKARSENLFDYLNPVPLTKAVVREDKGKSGETVSVNIPKKWADFFRFF